MAKLGVALFEILLVSHALAMFCPVFCLFYFMDVKVRNLAPPGTAHKLPWDLSDAHIILR